MTGRRIPGAILRSSVPRSLPMKGDERKKTQYKSINWQKGRKESVREKREGAVNNPAKIQYLSPRPNSESIRGNRERRRSNLEFPTVERFSLFPAIRCVWLWSNPSNVKKLWKEDGEEGFRDAKRRGIADKTCQEKLLFIKKLEK